MPASWTSSYKLLEAGLLKLRAIDPQLYWHVSERYLRCRSSTITMIVERNTSKGVLREPRRVVVELWDPKVQKQMVNKAISWLETNIVEELYLPKELLAVFAS